MIPFGDWAPDQTEAALGGLCMVADGVMARQGHYAPMAGPSVPTGAAAFGEEPRGGLSVRLADGTWRLYMLEETELFLLGADYTWTSVEGGFTGPDAGENWSCVQFGKYLLITNRNDGLWAYDTEAGGTGTYIAEAGDPVSIFTANQRVIGLNTKDNAGTRDTRRLRVSAVQQHAVWKGNGADTTPLSSGGNLVAGGDMLGGAALLIQDNMLRVMRFGDFGNNRYYAIEVLSDEFRAVGANSVVFINGVAYLLATDGWCRVSLRGVERIGAGRIDTWFLDRADAGNLELVQGAVDPLNKCVVWRWKREDVVSETVFNDLLLFYWAAAPEGRWTTAQVPSSFLISFATPGYGVDDYDAAVDDTDVPVDDRFWAGGQPLFGILNGDYKVALMAGTSLAGTIQTATAQNPVTGLMQWCRPLTDCAEATIAVGASDNLQSDLTWSSAEAIGESGLVPLDARGLNIAFRVAIPAGADWSYARGITDVRGSQGGPR